MECPTARILPACFELVQGGPDIVRDLIRTEGRVKKQQVDPVGPQTLQAFVNRLPGPSSR